MFPMAIFGLLAGLLTWASRPKDGIGFKAPAAPTPRLLERQLVTGEQRALRGVFVEENVAPGFIGPPLQPLEERLLCLLVLWGKDKRFPAGKKKFMNKALLLEAAKIALQLGLKGTAKALVTGGKIPANEKMGRRGVTVVDALVAYSKNLPS